MTEGPRPRIALSLTILAATLAAALTGALLTRYTGVETSLWWNAAGSGVIVAVVSPRRWWLPLLTVIFLGYIGSSMLEHDSLRIAAAVAGVGIGEIILIAVGIQRYVGREINTLRDLARLLAVAAAGNGVATLCYSAIAGTLIHSSPWHTVGPTFSSHFTWTILLAVYVLTRRRANPAGWRHIAAQSVTVAMVTVLVFARGQSLPLTSVVIPVALWAALVLRLRLVAIQQVFIATYVTAVTILGWGPFATLGRLHLSYALSQIYLAGMAVVTLAFALALREQREAAADAVEQRRRIEAVMDSSRMAIAVVDAAGVVETINPATVTLTGYPHEDLIGQPVWDVLLPAANRADALANFVKHQGTSRQAEASLLRADGEFRTVAYSVGLLAGAVGLGSARYVVTATDVTAERTRSRLLDHLLGSQTSTGIVATTDDGIVTLWNVGAQTILGLSPDDVTGREFIDLFDPGELRVRSSEHETSTLFTALIAHGPAAEVPQTRDWTMRRPEGTTLTVSITSSVVHDNDGHNLGHLFLIRDVTEVRHNQELVLEALEREQAAVEHLRALDRTKDDFVSTVSHELRTPLTSILGSVEMIIERMAGPLTDKQLQLTGVIQRNGERLLDLVDDLLLVATFDHETPPRSDDVIDLREVVRAVQVAAEQVAEHAGITIVTECPTRGVPIRGDHQFLERAVSNLIVNAIKFSPAGSEVAIQLTLDEARRDCHLSVIDHGEGISEADIPKLFERFFRADTSHNRALPGTGLGLPIVKSVVENHGGQVSVESRVGEGTTFTIRLPLA